MQESDHEVERTQEDEDVGSDVRNLDEEVGQVEDAWTVQANCRLAVVHGALAEERRQSRTGADGRREGHGEEDHRQLRVHT